MIKKISTSALRIGMYVDSLDCNWMDHPFVTSQFAIKDPQIIQKIASAGIRHVRIDTERGLDVDEVPAPDDIERQLEAVAALPDRDLRKTGTGEEIAGARTLFREATSVIRNMMADARLGKQVEVQTLDPLAERMVQIAIRNHHALNSVTRIKTKDEYTFMHCVSVAGLMITFARERGLPEDTIHQVAIGGLVHDIGKTLVPDRVLNKPGKLEPPEMDVMKNHVTYSGELLKDNLGITQVALDVTMLHHERMDGTGYPLGLKGDEISLIGQMSAIVDVYDALTSVRVYKNAWEPSVTLKKMLEWSPNHFNPQLVQHFIRCLGIYPVGSLVELESGRVGIVIEPGADMLRPKLRIVYNARRRHYERVVDLDLADSRGDRIVAVVAPEQYNIDVGAFV